MSSKLGFQELSLCFFLYQIQEYYWYHQHLCHYRSRKPEGVHYSEALHRTWDGEKGIVDLETPNDHSSFRAGLSSYWASFVVFLAIQDGS